MRVTVISVPICAYRGSSHNIAIIYTRYTDLYSLSLQKCALNRDKWVVKYKLLAFKYMCGNDLDNVGRYNIKKITLKRRVPYLE